MYSFFINLCVAWLLMVMLMLTSYLMGGGRLWQFAGFYFNYIKHNKHGSYAFYCVLVMTVALIRVFVQ